MRASKNRTYRVDVKFDNPSWIRRWFMRQDDWTLWCIGFVWLLGQVSVAFALITIFLKGLVA